MSTQPDVNVLSVGTAWHSLTGGIDMLNQRFCTALARAGLRVFCRVSPSTHQEIAEAERQGVVLVPASPGPRDFALARRPHMPGGVVPDLVIGHGRFTGLVARGIAEDHFPTATRLHFLHVAPDEIEWHKNRRGEDAGDRAEHRTALELELAKTADRAVAIGPMLHNRYLTELSAFDGPPPLRFVPGFDAGPVVRRTPPPGAPVKILLSGRVEDSSLKGLDLAAWAVGLAARRRGPSTTGVEFVVYGARPGTSAAVRSKVLRWAGHPGLNVVVRPYTSDGTRLAVAQRTASLALMPSRTEGFGLAGAEAIAAGTPVLVSSTSGLGLLIGEELGPDSARPFVVPVSGDDAEDAETWARAIEAVLDDRAAAFARAHALREHLTSRYSWDSVVSSLLGQLGIRQPDLV
ncbi:glycosyltransferase involved in cell wall biosynthesis [Kibdelosporangium banguiense]|uniref:Glycosyltransferase involved in cell wall biosynthesis n=1 Tax=Kibdelosporangium banguiense TaxID=1365924 RepID=A0ABS4TY85_9PSEU|nr:glycosyltransferase [Kibdelosporangium banguiense]MBP2329353.1 glycosyltransferase involved in cell wall biosynthesis [Kibdelosporangium banguiense]